MNLIEYLYYINKNLIDLSADLFKIVGNPTFITACLAGVSIWIPLTLRLRSKKL